MGREAAINVETTANVRIADALKRMNPAWCRQGVVRVEETGVFWGGPGKHPDILVRSPGGAPVVIETEFDPARTVREDAASRLGERLKWGGETVEQVVAVRIPAMLKSGDLEGLVAKVSYRYAVLSGSPDDPDRWPGSGWLTGTLADVATCVEHVSLSERKVQAGADAVQEGVEDAAALVVDGDAGDTLSALSEVLKQEPCEQSARMAMAIMANALAFHSNLVGHHGIKPIHTLRTSGRPSPTKHVEAWESILKINYWPIFQVAIDLLDCIPQLVAMPILERLHETASTLASIGISSSHDLSGQLFQRLITDRKFLATFYTLPSSATLLAELVARRLVVNWANREDVESLRIADFACGTGMLVNAMSHSIRRRYRQAGGDDRDIHRALMEDVVFASDIMPAATHLTASMLASAHPTETFGRTKIVTMPYGPQIGALELLDEEFVSSIFETGHSTVGGSGEDTKHRIEAAHGSFDAVVMNPPFTKVSSKEGATADAAVPAFAGMGNDDDAQRKMSRRLSKLRTPGCAGHGAAGLASHFIDVAHKQVRLGGTIGLIVPAAFVTSGAWRASRQLLATHYRNIVVATIPAVGRGGSAFSADTGMGEALVVATKRTGMSPGTGDTMFLSLRCRPSTVMEGNVMARETDGAPDARTGRLRTGGGGGVSGHIHPGGDRGRRLRVPARFIVGRRNVLVE